MSVVVVYRPMDEVSARALLVTLEGAGIRAELRQFHNPWEISWLEGRPWGEILVLEQDLKRARKVIEGFLACTPEGSELSEDDLASDVPKPNDA
jgi:hypothetical protein